MSFYRDKKTFPQEIWGEIMEHCSSETLKTLARVSACCHEEAQKRLWKCIRYDGDHCLSDAHNATDPTTLVCNLSLLRDVLSEGNFSWRSRVRRACICWAEETHHTVTTYWKDDGGPSQEDQDLHKRQVLFAHDFRQVAALISECAALEEFHLTMPCPFTVANVTSITLIPDDHELDRYGWRRVANVFWIPTLQHLQICGSLPETPIPDDLHHSGVSHITTLLLHDCKPISRELGPMFAWLRELRQLDISVFPELDYLGMSFPVNEAIEALQPLQQSLQHLKVDFGPPDHWPPEPHVANAFRSFSRLRRLDLPLEIFMQSDIYFSVDGRQPNLSFHTWLPHNLRKLVLRSYCIKPWNRALDETSSEDRPRHCVPNDPVHELFSRLHCLAEKKLELFPELRELDIVKSFIRRLWMECEDTRMSIQMIEEHGIMVEEYCD